ncbi:hypothetical protein [Ferrimonas pelagia]|uniref:Uncharacterized protein n=1 Tax=Ferrimonas pelagia TaxID=1177826 RepID=A0ABP9EUJ6_9GAMM
MDRDIDSEVLIGPWYQRTEAVDEQLPSSLVATMWLCMLASVDKSHLEMIGDCNMAVAFDLGIAVQVAEEELIPLPEMMAEVFQFYNDKLELGLPSLILANQVAASYRASQQSQHQLH